MKMTTEQQKLVEKNHNLIYEFAKRKNLVIDEYYGIIAIGLCKAAKAYDSNKGNFSTIAITCMTNEVNDYWKNLQSQKKIPNEIVMSYDATSVDEEGRETQFIDKITDGYNLADDVIDNINCQSLLNMLTDKEKLVVKYITKGLTQEQIANKINNSRQTVNRIVKVIRNKWSLHN